VLDLRSVVETVSVRLHGLREHLVVGWQLVGHQRGLDLYLLGWRGRTQVILDIVGLVMLMLINIIWICVNLLASDRSFTRLMIFIK